MREEIINSAYKKIQIKGLRKFTLDEIASDLKISKKTIYKYFKCKDDIINEYFNIIVESDKENMVKNLKCAKTIVEKIDAIIHSYRAFKLPVNVFDESYEYYNDNWKMIQKLRDYKLNYIELIIKDGVKNGEIREGINTHMITLILESISDTLLDYKFLKNNNLTMPEASKEIMDILLNGILKKNYITEK